MYAPALRPSEQGVLQTLPAATEYRLEMTIAPDYLSVRGRAQVRYTNAETEPLNELFFRLFPNDMGGKMTVDEVLLNGRPVASDLRYDDTALVVVLTPALGAGESVIIELTYAIAVPDDPETGYGLLSYSGGILALDSPYPMIPVFDDEGWNVETPPLNADTSYNDLSFYLVRITAPAALTLMSVGVEIGRQTAGDTQVVTYAAGPVRDFYLAGSEQYEVTSADFAGVVISSYALPDQQAQAEAGLQFAVAALKSFSARFGPYPYSEFELGATPMLALGIEYPGVIGLTTKLYREDAEMGGRPVSVVIETTIAHELAHQWFYNLIGSDQIDEPWLDEALAQYATSLYLLDTGGEAAAQGYRDTWYARWDRVNRLAKPVGLPAEEYDGREYSAIVYGRGPVFVYELAQTMGQETFDRFLRRYTTEKRWRIATTADFERLAEAECGCDLTPLFKEWVTG